MAPGRTAIQRLLLRWVFAAVLAPLLILQQLVAPAQTLAGRNPVPVCSAAGLIWLDPATGQPAAPASDQRALAHLCCLLHHGSVVPPKPLAVVARLLPLPLRWRRPSSSAVRASSARPGYKPRAPPHPSAML